ncbi:MAG: hypothetical protein CFE43_00260 [Burkholderiales bacterium PBB3]|nr:MAG: hypothetical protein CFE43_00260 [Burkholderiales bacterium PBB3]
MDKSNPPTTFGVFKPVGHTVIAFASDAERQVANMKLSGIGFGPESIVTYSSGEMVAQVDEELSQASPFANFGYEMDLIKAHRALAKHGSSFLVVEAPTDEQAQQVAGLVKTLKPQAAQHYGHFMIQELTEKPPGRMGEHH